MRQLILLFSICVIASTAIFSQTITGVVTDENHKALKTANVLVKGISAGVSTDANGSFSLNLKPGNYVLVVSYMGYETTEVTAEAKQGGNPINISLMPRSILTDEVVVSATRAGIKSPTAYVNIDADELAQRNSIADIPNLLELTPSFIATSEAGNGVGYTNFRVRGTDATRINVTVNGIPLNDTESQSIFWVNMPDFTSSVSSLQIQRGVGTSGNGSAAFGATLNFETHVTENKPYAGLQFFGGSFNTFKENFTAGTGIMDNGFSFDMRLSKLNSDGYVNYSGSDHASFFVSGAWRNRHNLIRANIIYGKERTGISWWGVPKDSLNTNRRYNPAGEYYDEAGVLRYYEGQTDNYRQTHYHLLYSGEFGKYLNVNAALHYTRGNGYYEQYEQDQFLPEYGFAFDSLSDMIIRKMMANDFYGGTYSLSLNRARLHAVLGGAANRYDGNHFGNIIWMRTAYQSEVNHEYYRNTGVKTDVSNYLKINYDISDKLSAYGDIQYRFIQYDLAGTDDDLMPDGSQKQLDQTHRYNFINPKAGLFYDITNHMNAYVSFAIGHREPTRANFEDAVGDPLREPKREILYDYEAGWRFVTSKLFSSVNLYYMDYVDQIIPTGEKNSVGYDIMTNVPKSYRLGIELSGGVNIAEKLSLSTNITLSRNKIRNFTQWAAFYDENWDEQYLPVQLGETDIAYSPSLSGSFILQWKAFKNFTAAWTAKYVGTQYFDNTMSQNRKLDPYFLNNLQFDYVIITGKKGEIALRLAANNIFDVKYSSNAYGGLWYEQGTEQTWAYYYPQAGINFLGGLSLKF